MHDTTERDEQGISSQILKIDIQVAELNLGSTKTVKQSMTIKSHLWCHRQENW